MLPVVFVRFQSKRKQNFEVQMKSSKRRCRGKLWQTRIRRPAIWERIRPFFIWSMQAVFLGCNNN